VSSGILQVHGWHLALMISVLRLLSVPFFCHLYTDLHFSFQVLYLFIYDS
jgi:hypothetical protein